MKFVKDVSSTFLAVLGIVLLTIGTNVVVARILGPGGKGAYSLITLICSLLALVGNLGIGLSGAYFGGKKKYELHDIISTSVISAIGLGLVLAVLSIIYFVIFHPSFLWNIELKAILLAVSILPFNLLILYFGYIMLGQNRIGAYNILNLAQAVSLLVLTLILLLIIRPDVMGATIALASTAIITAVLSVVFVRSMARISLAFHPTILMDSIKFGYKGYLGDLIQFFGYRLNMFLVSLYLGLQFIGYYSVAVLIAEGLLYFSGAIGTVLFARTITLPPEESNKSTPVICRNTLLLTALAAPVLFVLSRYLIMLLFGPDFLPALRPLQILLPGVVALSVCKIIGNEIMGRGKPIINLFIATVCLAIGLPLNLILIPIMGINGAALASTISYIAAAAFAIAAYVKISRVNWIDLIIPKREDLKVYGRLFSDVLGLDAKKWD